MSKFEQDPSVQAFRKWAYQAGRTVNSGHYTSPALSRLMTAVLARQIKRVLGPDVGTHYPGPLPFQPVGIVVLNSTRRDIRGCLVTAGWGRNPRTHKPAERYRVIGARAQMNKQAGRWLVGALPADMHTSCAHVTVRTRTW